MRGHTDFLLSGIAEYEASEIYDKKYWDSINKQADKFIKNMGSKSTPYIEILEELESRQFLCVMEYED